MEEKKFKYCSVYETYLFTGSNYFVRTIELYNNNIEKLRLLKMTPNIYLYDVATELVKNVATNVHIFYGGGDQINEYMERVVSVSGSSQGQGYPDLAFVYPYEQRDWVYPVIMEPGSSLKFNISVTLSQSLSSVQCFMSLIFIFENV